jgi:glucose-6-phosphate-specific signal transduction histidine kinase
VDTVAVAGVLRYNGCRRLVPIYAVIMALLVAWRWQWVGSILFVGLGLVYLLMARGQFPWSVYAIISGPLFLLAALFLLGWLYGGRLEAPGKGA